MSKLNELAACVEAGNTAEVVALTQAALDEGNAPLDVLNIGLVEPINVLGEQFRLGQIYVPELLVASKAMKMGVEVVKPLLMGDNAGAGKAVFATVEGDMHDIGKNLCVMLLESAGFEVTDLGMDVEWDFAVSLIPTDEEIAGIKKCLMDGEIPFNAALQNKLCVVLGVEAYNAFVTEYNGK